METTEQTSACHLIVVFIGVKLVTSEHVYPSQSVMKEQFSLLVTPSHHHQKIIVHKCNEQIKMTPSAPPPLPPILPMNLQYTINLMSQKVSHHWAMQKQPDYAQI